MIQFLAPVIFGLWIGGALSSLMHAKADSPSSCENFKTHRDVLACALEHDPDQRVLRASIRQIEESALGANQLPNPEISAKLVVGDVSSNGVFNSQIDMSFPIELGGKRARRVERSQIEKNAEEARAFSAREEVYIRTLLALYRIRQFRSELKAIDYGLSTFARIQRQYHLRLKLSPEQNAALKILETTSAEQRLRKSPLETNLAFYRHEVEHSIGFEFDPSDALLPPVRETWPVVSQEELAANPKGASIRLSETALLLAHAEEALADANAWPTFKLGPTIERQTQGAQTYSAYGANLSLGLPLFHRNNGERSTARFGILKADEVLRARRTESQHEREFYFFKYQSTVKALSETPPIAIAEGRHREVVQLFARGSVPSTLLLESHRQLLEYIKSRDELELAAVEAVARYFALQGRLFEEKL